jgi:hypothetical protein
MNTKNKVNFRQDLKTSQFLEMPLSILLRWMTCVKM